MVEIKQHENCVNTQSHTSLEIFGTMRCLTFMHFRPKFEAVGEVMDHLTYTRKRYNPDEAPEGLDGVDACERECHGMLHSLPVHLVDSFVHLLSSFAPPFPRSRRPLKPTFIPRNSFLNVAAQCNEARRVHRPVIAVH